MDVSFSVGPGETVALVGESGSGKSVTSQAIMGILPANAIIRSGQILFNNPETGQRIDIAGLDPESAQMRQIRGGNISIIFQEPMTSLSPVHTIGDQVSEALFLHRDASRQEGMKLTEAMLKHVGFPDPARALRMYPFELSGGLRQRAMIAMAMITHPSLLIADEPTTALDVTIQARILKLIRELQAELGMALLLITHDLGVVSNMSDRVVVMYHGRVMEAGPLQDLFSNPQHDYLKALMHAVPRFDLEPGERLVPVREIHSETGALIKQQTADQIIDSGTPHLQVNDASKTYRLHRGSWLGTESRDLLAVDRVSLSVERGECFGLVGESGCGKTTLSKIIMRAITPDQGEIVYHDGNRAIDVRALDNSELLEFRRKMQFIFQDPYSALNPRMTVFDILREPLVVHNLGDIDYQREMATELMRLVGLDPRFLNRYPHSFSGGQRQRIGIARALALQPDLIICDEPVSALDVSIQAQVLNLLKDLQQELGLTFLFISHNLAVIHYIANRIAVMCKGRIVELAPRDLLFANPIHPYTRALLSAVPHPELSQPLDFTAITEGAASEPQLWPAPFTLDGASQTEFLELAEGHFVRVAAGCKPSDLAA
ncbi:MAG: ABC transporter ATP-binding protein [Gammaproteobacteria bacterium]|nr:MAG: ABC transporter ATP-binding protein [Gammaproteobacteria bacterium]UCH42012.1 MAG: ABC transporter ATP-binding protein [Gammaproteobacteria bacterium]